MKILQINSVCGFGSTGRIATDLYKVYEEAGHECVIAYGRGIAPEGYKTIKIGSKFDNYTHVAKTRILDKHGFGSKRATEKFIEEVKILDPDVIHLHNIHGYYINIEILFNYLKEADKKVIWTLHDCWAFTGHCSYFDYVGCDKWKTGCSKCPQKKEYPSSNVLDNSFMNYEKKKELFTGLNDMTIITPSKWLGSIVEESFLKEYKIKVIYNGINLDVFKYRDTDIKKQYNIEDKKIILGVANIWDKRKGIDSFIKLSKVLDQEYQIILVGISSKQKKKLPQNIIGIMRTSNIKELTEFYSIADVFLNPSNEETMGLVTIEALACGTFAIVNNKTAMPEIIDESCGKVVDMFNIDLLIQEIIDIKYKNNSLKSMCQKRAKRFELYKNLRGYLEFINISLL